MALHNDLGKSGECAAAKYLEDKGYQILERNWRKGHYELDIIAQTEDELVIVEVKTRADDFYENPEDAVSNKKINRIVSAANSYVRLFRIDLPVRFDIIAVLGFEPHFEIDHIEEAFYPPMRTHWR
jgi:Predicted endonuclease distantly related to archaeal Holliday junction resolvase